MPEVFRTFRNSKLLSGAGALFGGHSGSAILNLLSLSIAARSLGPESLGILVLVTSYVHIVDQIANCQSWHALIKYGADCLSNDDLDGLKRLIKFGLVIDVVTALLGSCVAVAVIFSFGDSFGWTSEMINFAAAYSVLIALNVTGVPIALLRLFGKFSWLAVQAVSGSVVRFAGTLCAAVMDFEIAGYLAIWFLSQATGYLLFFWLGYLVARRRKLGGVMASDIGAVRHRHKGIWGFVVTTNLQSSIRLGTTELDTMIVGGILGPAGAGFYGVVKRFARVLGLVSTPLVQVVYPALAKHWSRGRFDLYRRLVVQATLIVSVISVAVVASFAFFGDLIILYSVGRDFLSVHVPLTIYIIGVALATSSFALYPALLAAGRPRATFVILCISTVVYLPVLTAFTYQKGLLGATTAHVIFYAIWVPLSAITLLRTYRAARQERAINAV